MEKKVINRIKSLLNRQTEADIARKALLEALSNIKTQCAIVGKTPEGAFIIVLGKPLLEIQLQEIAKNKGVEL